MSHSPVRYVSFPLSALPRRSHSKEFLLRGRGEREGRTKEGREGGKYGLTNSECKSWLIVVDTVALRNFSTTTIAQKLRDGMERRREISRNVWKVPLPSLRKLLATIASLNEILINYSTGNRECQIVWLDPGIRSGARLKSAPKKKKRREEIYRRFWLVPFFPASKFGRRRGRDVWSFDGVTSSRGTLLNWHVNTESPEDFLFSVPSGPPSSAR